MSWRGTWPIAALLVAAVLAAGALVACGDSDTDTSGSAASQETASSAGDGSQGTAAGNGGQGGGSKGGASQGGASQGGSGSSDSGSGSPGSDSGDSGSQIEVAPLKVSGGGSEQFRQEGGDNSIQDFGEESEESELEDAAEVLHGYLVARAEQDWAAACSKLSKALVTQLESFASRTKQLAGSGCADVLGAWTPPLPVEVREESTIVDAGSLRLEGERAFLIYRGAKENLFAMPMAAEDDGWKVAALAPAPLS